MGASLAGVSIFLRAPWWLVPLALTTVSATLAFSTTHPTADPKHRRRWTLLGACAGLHAAALALFLPVGLLVHGAIAALMVAFPLRLRRYAFAPHPSRAHAWSESVIASVLLLGLLVSARWA